MGLHACARPAGLQCARLCSAGVAVSPEQQARLALRTVPRSPGDPGSALYSERSMRGPRVLASPGLRRVYQEPLSSEGTRGEHELWVQRAGLCWSCLSLSVCPSVSGSQECGRPLLMVGVHAWPRRGWGGRQRRAGWWVPARRSRVAARWRGCGPTSDVTRGLGPGGAEPDRALGGGLGAPSLTALRPGAPVQGSFPPSARFHPAPCPLENVS